MMPLDGWAVAALLALLALFATLRLAIPVGGAMGPLRWITHPNWLLPLVLAIPWTVGLMLRGMIPLWPPQAREMVAADYGYWAGIAALIVVATAELWLLWVPSMVAQRFAKPESRSAFRTLPLLNLVFGGGLLLLLWSQTAG